MRERQILYQVGNIWVADANNQYTVYVDGTTYAKADSSYSRTKAGFSIAKARVDYLSKRRNT